MKRKSTCTKLAAAFLCAAFLDSCGTNSGQNTAGTESAASTSLITMDMVTYAEEDYYTDWKNESPSYIQLNGASATLNGSGAEIKEGRITITKAGVYAISGKLNNGQIIVDLQDKEKVRLVLNGAEISSQDSAPIYVKSAEKVIISLEDGTSNILTDGENYVLEDPTADEPSGTLFSKGDLTINGNGTLTVNGSYKDGIVSKDELRITGGNIQINSADDGLIGRDMVLAKAGSITIEAGGDGIKSTNDEEADKGFIALEGGTYKITAGADGIQAETSVIITDGKYTITTGGGSINSSDKTDNQMGPWGRGNGNMEAAPDADSAASQNTEAKPEANSDNNAQTSSNEQSTESEAQSAKAIKASSEIAISGGSFTIDSADDAIHSNNSVNISEGDISIASGDDGIHGDSTITIKDGKINISKSYEGIESAIVSISGGEINIVAKDDGVNVAGGNDQSSMNGRPGQNSFNSSGNNKLNINGGYIVVNAEGDGLDSNGSIYMTNGKVFVNGPTSSGNGALDYNGAFEITGGLMVAAGSSGMAQAPSEESAQYSIIMSYPSTQKAGILAVLKDSSGNKVVEFAPEKDYQTLVVCAPELKKNGSYTLYSGATKVVEFTISDTVTWLDETGVTEARSTGPGSGGKGGFGGGGTRPSKVKP